MVPEEKQALALIEEAAEERSLDELGKRARAALAAGADVDEAGQRAMIEFWRQKRAMWGQGKDKEEEDE